MTMTENCMKYVKLLGFFAIVVSLVTWGMDLMGVVEKCAFCQVQRTVIGILGVLMVFPNLFSVCLLRYSALLFGFYGAHVAVAQSFDNFRRWSNGVEIEPIFIILSTLAFIFIILQVYMIFCCRKEQCN